jgi:urease accessory protein UreF
MEGVLMMAIKPRGRKHATLQIADYFVPPTQTAASIRAARRCCFAIREPRKQRRFVVFLGRKVCELTRELTREPSLGRYSRDRIASSVQIHYATMLPAITKRDNPASQKIANVNSTNARAQQHEKRELA